MYFRKRKLNNRYYVLTCILKEYNLLSKTMKKAIHKKDDTVIVKELTLLLDNTDYNDLDKIAWLRIFYKNFVYEAI